MLSLGVKQCALVLSFMRNDNKMRCPCNETTTACIVLLRKSNYLDVTGLVNNALFLFLGSVWECHFWSFWLFPFGMVKTILAIPNERNDQMDEMDKMSVWLK